MRRCLFCLVPSQAFREYKGQKCRSLTLMSNSLLVETSYPGGGFCGRRFCMAQKVVRWSFSSSKEWDVLKMKAVNKQIANFKKVTKLARFREPFPKVLEVVSKCWEGLGGQNLPPAEIPRKYFSICWATCRLCRGLWGYSYSIHHFCVDELFSEVRYIWVMPVPLMISHSLVNNRPRCIWPGSIL